MFLCDLFEDVKSDIKYSKEAENIIFSIYNYLYNELDANPKFELPELEWRGKTSLCFVVGEIDKKYDDLLIIFRKLRPTVGASLAHISDSRFKFLIILNIEGDENYIKSRLLNKNIQQSFIHELQHYFDIKRYKNRDEPDASYDEEGEMSDPVFLSNYYNNSLEYNAYFHNIAEPLLYILRIDAEIAREFADSFDFKEDFNEFLKSSIKGRNLKIFNHFNETYRKKMLKRLFALHKTVKEYLRKIA
jgi:hypothetical protein